MNGEFEQRLSGIDAARNAFERAEQRLAEAFGSIAVDIEIIANEHAIEAIKQDNPDIDYNRNVHQNTFDPEEAKKHLIENIDRAIEAKKDSVFASYLERKEREGLLNEG